MNNVDLAELIFPDVKETLADLDKKYPPRNLKDGALVTRFAPSPTGFLHTGSLFTSLVAYASTMVQPCGKAWRSTAAIWSELVNICNSVFLFFVFKTSITLELVKK